MAFRADCRPASQQLTIGRRSHRRQVARDRGRGRAGSRPGRVRARQARRGSPRALRAAIATTTSDRGQRIADEARDPVRSCADHRPARRGLGTRRAGEARSTGQGRRLVRAADRGGPSRRTRRLVRQRIDTHQPTPASAASQAGRRAGPAAARVVPRRSTGEEPHRLGPLQGGQDQRPAEPRSQDRAAHGVRARDPEHQRVLDAADLGRPAGGPASRAACRRAGDRGCRPRRRRTGGSRRSGPRRAPRVDRDPVEALDDLERHLLAMILDRIPAATRSAARAGPGGRRAGGDARLRTAPPRRSGR